MPNEKVRLAKLAEVPDLRSGGESLRGASPLSKGFSDCYECVTKVPYSNIRLFPMERTV